MITDIRKLHRINHWLGRYHCKLMMLIMRVIWGCHIHPNVTIGEGTVFIHQGLGVVIGDGARIGRDVVIMPQVGIGANGYGVTGPRHGMPIVEDNVLIGTGAKILGPVTVGRNSVIGANSVVLKDVPANSVAIGIPARIAKSNIQRTDYYRSVD